MPHPVLALVLSTAFALVAGQKETAREKTSDEKIAFYRARIGGPGTYPAHARLGLAYLQKFRETGKSNYYDEGLRCLRQSLSYQGNFEALLGMAVGLSERHFFKEALPYAQEALAAMPSDLEAAGALFDIRLALGKVLAAEEGLNAMLSAQAGFHALSRLATFREYRGDVAGALEAMMKARDDAARTLPKSTLAWAEVRIGSLQVARCEVAKAREAYDRALALVPNYFFANEHLAEWHAAHGQWKEAERLFRQLLKSHPAPQYRLGLADVCRGEGKTRESKRETEKVLAELRQSSREGAQDPFRPLALILLARKETAAEGLHWAMRDWEVRQDALAADTLAWANHCNGYTQEAVRLSEQALQSGSKNPALLLHGGLIRCRSGRKAEGRALLEQALACLLAFGPHERTLAASARQALAGD
jgi:tetratricopeptide (TPR) repeat protein